MVLTKYLLVIFIALAGCAHIKQVAEPDAMECDGIDLADIKVIPLLRLIANPKRYHGECVSTSGYLSFGFEDNAIYLRLEDYLTVNTSNGVIMTLPFESDLYDESYYKDHEGVVIGVVEDYIANNTEKTIFHLYKTQFQLHSISIEKDLISRSRE